MAERQRRPPHGPAPSSRATRAADHAAIERLTGELLPGARRASSARPASGSSRSARGLAWRVRLRRRPDAAEPRDRRARSPGTSVTAAPDAPGAPGSRLGRPRRRPRRATNGSHHPTFLESDRRRGPDARSVATSPAVGTFQPRADLRPGSRVRGGDRLGVVDMLGIAQEVVAPVDGIVGAPASSSPATPSSTARSCSVIEFDRTRRRTRPGARRPDVPQGPHRQSRRDRPAHPARVPDARRSRPSSPTARRTAIAARPAGRRGDLHRPGRGEAVVPVGARGHLGRRSSPAATRSIPGTASCPRTTASPRSSRAHDLTFIGPPAGSPRAVREQGRHPPDARRPRPADDPGLGRDAARRRSRARARRSGSATRSSSSRRRAAAARGCAWSARPRELEFGAARSAAREAKAAFGDDSLYLEKWLERHAPRRGPGRGRPLRPRRPPRRARLLRPAPPPEDPRGVAHARPSRPAARTELAERAVRAVVAAGYENVGTLEFLVDAGRQLLLHRDQLPDPGGAPGDRDADRGRPRRDADPDRRRRAARHRPGRHRDARPRHRVPDQRRGRRPTTSGPGAGIVERYHAPGGPGVRMDSHLYPGYEVPPYYDSLLGKLIVWGPDRETAIARGRRSPSTNCVLDGTRHERPHPPRPARVARRSSRAG